jgi:neutral ceramidase
MNQSEKNNLNQLLAGAAKTDITPPLGTFINGDFVSHYAQWIHDPLYSKALVLQENNTTIAIVVVDICVLPVEFVEEVKSLITKQTGIRLENVLLSSTHTHAAGSVASVYLCTSDLLYTKKLPALIAQSVMEAQQNLRPAKIGFGSTEVPEHVRCRRYFMEETYQPLNPVTADFDKIKTNPFGKEELIIKAESETDPQVSFFAVQGIDGKWISLVANYSLHYVGDWDNGTISADYFGVFSEAIKQELKAGDEFVGMMSNGTSANINIWDFNKDGHYPSGKFEKSELIGKDIAEKVFQSFDQIQWEEDPSLEIQYEELPVGVRKPTIEELERARKIIAESSYENLQVNDEGLRSIYAREQVLLNELPDELKFPIQALKIGGGIIGALGAEIFAETGLWLKANAPTPKYFTIGLANGNCGYLPPAHEFLLGGYETWRSRTSKLEKDVEEKVRSKQLQLINNFSVDLKK